MLRAIALGFSSLADRKIMMVLATVVALTLLVFLLLGVGLWFGVDAAFATLGLNDTAMSAAASLAVLLFFGWLLFRSVAIAMTWLFADDIIDAVEARHYAFSSGHGKRPDFATSARMALRSVGRAIGYNLVMSPIYLILLFTGVGTALAFLGVNGYLIGRDLEDMLVARHSEGQRLGPIRRFVLGLASAAGMIVPLLQFVIPVVATATAVHMVHDRSGKL